MELASSLVLFRSLGFKILNSGGALTAPSKRLAETQHLSSGLHKPGTSMTASQKLLMRSATQTPRQTFTGNNFAIQQNYNNSAKMLKKHCMKFKCSAYQLQYLI